MEVFHGSYMLIDKIDLSKGQPNRDFGQGFYVTKYKHHAQAWAEIIGGKNNVPDGVVTEFIYYDSPFSERLCNIKHFDSYNEEWLDFIVKNRNPLSPQPTHNYDIVEGPVANDKVQWRLTKYLQGKIEKEVFLKELTYHESTHQICFCTMKSLLCLEHKDKTFALHLADIGESVLEKIIIDHQIDESKAYELFFGSNMFSQLSDISTQYYRKPWQEIYEMLKKELKML